MGLFDDLTDPIKEAASAVYDKPWLLAAAAPMTLPGNILPALAGPASLLYGTVQTRRTVEGKPLKLRPSVAETLDALMAPGISERDNPLRRAPLIGEEAARVTSPLTSPAGALMTAIFPAATLWGTAGAGVGGELGLLLEQAGWNPRLELDLPALGKTRLGPRSAGELIGGAYAGPGRAGASKLRQRDLLEEVKRDAPGELASEVERTGISRQLDMFDEALKSGRVDLSPDERVRLQQLRAQVDDDALGAFDYAGQMQRGKLPGLDEAAESPFGLDVEVDFEGFFRSVMDDRVGQGPLAWLPAPVRGPVGLLSKGLTSRRGTPEEMIINRVYQMETAGERAAFATMNIGYHEQRLGFLRRARSTGEKVGEAITGRRVVYADEAIPNIAAGKGGMEPTLLNLMHHRSAFDDVLTAQQRGLLEAADRTYENIRKAGARILGDAGYTPDEIDDILRVSSDGENYFHRIGIDNRGEPLMAGARRAMGRTQPFQEATIPEGIEHGVRFSGSLHDSVAHYADEVFHAVADNAYWLPMMKRIGKARTAFQSRQLTADIDILKGRSDWLSRARVLAHDARVGRTVTDVQARARQLAADDVPEEWKRAVLRLTAPLAEQGGESLPESVVRAAKRPDAALDDLTGLSDVAGREAVGLKAYRDLAKTVEKELGGFRMQNVSDLAYLNDAQKMFNRAQKRGYMRMLDAQKFPGLTQHAFPSEWADEIEQAWKRMGDAPSGVTAALNNVSAITQGIQAGTMDAGQFFLQLLPLWNPVTAASLPSIMRQGLTRKMTAEALMSLQTEFSRSGDSMFDLMVKYGPRMLTESATPSEIMARPGGLTSVAADVVQNVPTNRYFTNTVALGRTKLFTTMVKIAEGIKRDALTPDQYRALGRVAGTFTGDFNWTRAGISRSQRASERAFVRYAPSWLRAGVKMAATSLSPNLGLEQNAARALMATMIGSVAGTYAAIAESLGQTPHFNPAEPGDFLTVEVNGVKVGVGGALRSIMTTTAKMAELTHVAATGTEAERDEALRKLLDLREEGSPLKNFWRSGAPVLSGLIYDTVVEGRQAYTDRPLDPFTKEGAINIAIAGGEMALPFSAQSLVEGEGLTAMGAGMAGFRNMPLTPYEKFLDAADAKAKEMGYRRWVEVPKALQADVLRTDVDLGEMDAASKAYLDKFGDSEDAAFKQIDQSRRAIEDMMLASWSSVEAGGRDRSEWRQQFSDLMAQHAYLSNRLLDAQGNVLEKGKDETKQDYYARLYAAIQPEMFDADADGFLSEEDWQRWRGARTEFWAQFPEANNYREYITQDYKTRLWQSEEMAGIVGERYRALDLQEQFLSIPKYRGMTAEDATFIDGLRQLKGRVAEETRFRMAEAGRTQPLDSRAVWRMTLQVLQGSDVLLSSHHETLIKYAILMDDARYRTAFRNPEREAFLAGNPLLVDWYPSVLEEAGVDRAGQAALGLEEPRGTTSGELLGQLAGVGA